MRRKQQHWCESLTSCSNGIFRLWSGMKLEDPLREFWKPERLLRESRDGRPFRVAMYRIKTGLVIHNVVLSSSLRTPLFQEQHGGRHAWAVCYLDLCNGLSQVSVVCLSACCYAWFQVNLAAQYKAVKNWSLLPQALLLIRCRSLS